MSYINKDGEKVVVWCPESKDSMATQDPRKTGDVEIVIEKQPAAFNPHKSKSTEKEAVCQKEYLQEFTPVQATTAPNAIIDNDPKPKSLAIRYGDTGYSYDKLFADYLKGQRLSNCKSPTYHMDIKCKI